MDPYFYSNKYHADFFIYRDRQAGMTPEQIRDLYENIFSSISNWELLNFWDHGKIRSNSYPGYGRETYQVKMGQYE